MVTLAEKLDEKEKSRNGNGGEYEVIHWKPAAGEIIEGIVEKLGTTITGYGEKEYLRLVDDTGKKWLVWCNIVLHNAIAEEGVAAGDRIAIRFKGMGKGQRGREYKDYLLVREEAEKEGD